MTSYSDLELCRAAVFQSRDRRRRCEAWEGERVAKMESSYYRAPAGTDGVDWDGLTRRRIGGERRARYGKTGYCKLA